MLRSFLFLFLLFLLFLQKNIGSAGLQVPEVPRSADPHFRNTRLAPLPPKITGICQVSLNSSHFLCANLIYTYTESRGVQFEQDNKKTFYLLNCNHAFRFPLKTSSAMHLCKYVMVHCFKIDTIVLFSIV